MDWAAFFLSLKLAAWTMALTLPIGLVLGRWLAWSRSRARPFVDALVAMPLVLPPTVLGYYFLAGFGGSSVIGHWLQLEFGRGLVFQFEGLVLASIFFNLPFAIQPMQRSFAAIAPDIRAAAWCSGLSRWNTFRHIELPLAWPGVISGLLLTFVHTLGEFGVVLMVGGAIPGETRTIAIAIYDQMQAFHDREAGIMAVTLLAFSFSTVGLTYVLTRRQTGPHG